jgi:hypothetical protein
MYVNGPEAIQGAQNVPETSTLLFSTNTKLYLYDLSQNTWTFLYDLKKNLNGSAGGLFSDPEKTKAEQIRVIRNIVLMRRSLL